MKINQIACLTFVLLIASHFIAAGQCSEFYGMTSDGGKNNGGTIFRTTGYGDSLSSCYSSVINAEGTAPYGYLCEADNGKFYGMTSSGGINYIGVLYEWDPLTNIYTKKLDFDALETGGWPSGSLMQAGNGKLYGVTQYGGSHNCGVLFEWDPSTDVFTKKIDFGNDCGSYPVGTLVQANDGKLCGMTWSGGNFNKGLIFVWDPESNVITEKFSFDGTGTGNAATGSLVKDASGHLYGMTSLGGAYDLGVLFELDPESGTFTKKMDFNGTETGSKPYGSLLIAGNNRLYGLTSTGGANQLGVLFEFDLAANSFSRKFDFDSLNGIHPSGPLTPADNGKLYGTTSKGGLYKWGVLYEWDPATEVFTKILDFNSLGKGYDRGSRSPLVEGEGGSLYGLTSDGGQAGTGTLYEWNYETRVFVNRLDFNYAPDGRDLKGSLVQAGNGKFYGTAYNGGIGDYGVLFEWDPATQLYVKKIDLSKRENGMMPFSLTQAKNGKFYGMTLAGGAYGQGVIFEWDMQANTYTKKIDFNQSQTGMYPRGSLIQLSNGKLYGLTKHGEKIDGGVLFEWDPETNIFIKRVEFGDVENGFWPEGTLLQASNGKIYGTTERGGVYGGGVLFEWDPVNYKYTKKFDFDINGYYPDGSLIQGSNEKLYGMTNSGGKSDAGILFEFDIQSNTCIKKLDLSSVIGRRKLLGYLLQASNGKIYGMAYAEGNTFGGVLFEFDPITNMAIKKFDFTKNSGTTPSSNLIEIGNKSSFSILNETACDKYNFNGKVLTSSGTYYDTIPNAAGCDSLITLNLTVNKSTLNTLFETACSEYNFNGRLLKTSGTYFDKIPNAYGCDSIMVLFLTILQPTSSSFSVTACNEFAFGGKELTTSGIYMDTIANAAGCDSLITLHLTIHHSTHSTLYVSACDSYTSPSGRHTWTMNGTYTDTIPNAKGCDSIITIYLSAPHRTEALIPVESCNEYISPSGRYVWTQSGKYVDNIQNAAGCDSIITVDLTIQKSTANIIYPASCGSYTSPSGLYTWYSSGTYSDVIPNARGCDSLMTIYLQIDQVDTAVIHDRSVLVSKDLSAAHQWIDCDNGYAPIPGEIYLTYTARNNGRYAVIVSNGACVDTSGIYEILLTGISDPTEKQVILYPNPTSGDFAIDLGKVYPEAMVTITRYDGQVVQKEKFSNNQVINLNLDAPPGVYMVIITADNEEFEFKLLKK